MMSPNSHFDDFSNGQRALLLLDFLSEKFEGILCKEMTRLFILSSYFVLVRNIGFYSSTRRLFPSLCCGSLFFCLDV